MLEIDETKLTDPGYLKNYFSKLDSLLTPYSENPVRLLHDLTIHLTDSLADTSNIFSETLLQGYLVRIVQTLLERRYPWTSWCDAAVGFLRLVVESIPKLIEQRFHPDELLRALEKIFSKRFLFYSSHGWNDTTDELRPKYFPSNYDPNQPELYAQVLPTEQTPSYWYLDMITTFGPAWEIIIKRISDAEHQLDAKALSQMLKIFEIIRNDLRKPFLLEIVPRLAEAVLGNIGRFSDSDLRSQNFDDILDSLNSLSKLASRVRLLKLAEEIEFYKLSLSVRCIQLPYLEARLKGIDQIKHLIQVAKGEAHHTSRARPRRQQNQGNTHMTAVMATWQAMDTGSTSYSRAGPSRGSRSDGGSDDESPDDLATTTSSFNAGDISFATGPVYSSKLYDSQGTTSPPHEEELLTFSTTSTAIIEDIEGSDDIPSSSATLVIDDVPDSASFDPDTTPSDVFTVPSPIITTTPSDDDDQQSQQPQPQPQPQIEQTSPPKTHVDVPAGQPLPPPGPAPRPPEASSSGPPPVPPKRKTKGLAKVITVQFVLNWIKENNILDIILGLEHEEALKQALVVVLFIAENEQGLDEATLLSVWNVAKRHESHARVVYKHLAELLEFLPSPQIDWIYARINELQPEDYNPQVLAFIGDFTREAIKIRKKRGEELKLYGLDIFWQTLMKASKAKSTDSAIVTETVDHLQKLLKDYPDQRDIFLQRCIENLKNGEMVSISLKLIRNILDAFRGDELNATIVSLNESFHLLDSLLTEFSRRAAQYAVPDRANLKSSQNENDTKAKPLEGRLAMLEFLLTNSGLTLSQEQIFALWDSLIPLPNAQRDHVFEWLQNAAFGYLVNDPFASGEMGGKSKNPILSTQTAHVFFVEKIAKLDKASFSLAAIKLYRRFFMMVNLRHRSLQRLEDSDVKVRSFTGLVGLHELWEIGMAVLDPVVALNALTLLRLLYTNVVPSQRRESLVQLRELVVLVLDQLYRSQTVLATDETGLAKLQVERCFSLLHAIVSRDNATRHPSHIHGQRTKIMRPKQPKMEDVKLPVGSLPALNLPTLPAAPSEGSQESPEQKEDRLRIEATRNELQQQHQQEETKLKLAYIDTMIQRRAEINQEKLAKFHQRQQLEKEHNIRHPADFISENHLDHLFTLISNPALRVQVWNLIQILPTPPHLSAFLQDLTVNAETSELDFVTYIGSPSEPTYVYRLLYVLQLVHVLIRDASWRQKLVASGRVGFFVDIFTQDLISESSGSFGKSAMSYIVDIMRELFTSPEISHDALAVDQSFVGRLMNQISSLAAQPFAPPQPDPPETKPELDLSILPSLPANKGTGTRFATTWYCGDKDESIGKILTFELDPPDTLFHFTAAVYCVDYNTKRRHQTVTCFMGTDRTVIPADLETNIHKCELTSSTGDEFHDGIWVVWDCYGKGPINFHLKTIDGPNWIFPCVMLGPPRPQAPDALPPSPSVFPNFTLDYTTRGAWRGRYGQWGGVILGKVDHRIPVRTLPDEAPRFGKYELPQGVLRYEWAHGRFTQDKRALQLIPTPDELEFDDEPEPAIDIVDNIIFTEDDAPKKTEYRDAVEDDRQRPLPQAAPPASSEPPPKPQVPAIEEEEQPLPQTSTALLEMLLSSVRDRSDLLPAVLQFPELNTWLFDILCKSSDESIRLGLVDAISQLDKLLTGEHSGFFLRILLGYLSTIGGLRGTVASFTQYFALLQCLLDNAASSGLAVAYDKRSLLNQLVLQLRDHPIIEADDSKEPDTAIIGIIDLIRTVLDGDLELQQVATQEYGLLSEIFGPCLFDCPVDRFAAPVPKCKLEKSREAAFKLLGLLGKNLPSNLLSILDKLTAFLESAPAPTDWAIDLSSKEQNFTGSRGRYIGLKNQGCTCYLNSTIQQLFIVPSLRRSILNVDMKASPMASQPNESENIMQALQTLFAFMQESKTSYVDPIAFCRQVRLNGAPIAMSRQEDALEFLNSLADQIEPYIKGLPQEHMLRDTFGGRFVHQIISHGCEHQSEREEPYLAISVKVQNKRNLKESLENFVQGDMLDGNSKYKCEQCSPEQYVVAKMRCCIEHLPDTLIIHLKRFEFSFETFENIKVYDHFEFPHELNMRPYTKEGLASAEMKEVQPGSVRPDDYYQYRLVGILIHSGSANSGHYYSYIKERQFAAGEEPRWYEFNDNSVTPFDPDTIPNHCFGGKHTDYRGTKHYSAYMLFYERATHYAACAYGPPLGPIGGAETQQIAEPTKEVDPEILDRIFTEGVTAAKKQQIMSRPTLDFVWDVVAGLDLQQFPPVLEYRDLLPEEADTPVVRIIHLATRYLFRFIAHCNDTHQLKSKAEHLAQLYAHHIPATKSFLDSLCVSTAADGNPLLREVVLTAPDDEIRLPFANLLSSLVQNLARHEYGFFFERDETHPKPTSVRFIDTIVSLLVASSDRHPSRIMPLLYILHRFAHTSSRECLILLQRNAIAELLALHEKSKSGTSGAWTPKAPLQYLFELLADLVTACENPAVAQPLEHASLAAELGISLKLSTDLLNKLHEKQFIIGVCREPLYMGPMRRIWKHFCPGDPHLFLNVSAMASSGSDTAHDHQHRKLYFEVFKDLLAIADSEDFQELRTRHIMSEAIRLLTGNLRIEAYRTPFLVFIFEVDQQFPLCHRWLVQHDDLNHLFKTNNEVHNWIELHQVESYVKLVSERDEYLATQSSSTTADDSGAFHDSDDGEDEPVDSTSSSAADP